MVLFYFISLLKGQLFKNFVRSTRKHCPDFLDNTEDSCPSHLAEHSGKFFASEKRRRFRYRHSLWHLLCIKKGSSVCGLALVLCPPASASLSSLSGLQAVCVKELVLPPSLLRESTQGQFLCRLTLGWFR